MINATIMGCLVQTAVETYQELQQQQNHNLAFAKNTQAENTFFNDQNFVNCPT